jgi:O-antigen/teichoic acid export membrane protein
MIIPESRMLPALVVYQCSIITCVVSVMSAPYNADIIAHEKMSAFAYISILEVVLKLVIVFLLVLFPYDRLIIYAILVLCIQILIRFVYAHYCYKHFEESKYFHIIDKSLLKEMSSFAGWSLFGSFSVVCCNQGVNLLLNTFFGPVVNAARGIAVSVQTAVNGFSGNFQTALIPQIIKTYAVGHLEEHHQLIFMACKFSACLLMIISLPILLETETILKLWLGNVPEYTINFIRIILLLSIWDSTAYPLATSIQAVGKIRTYQLVISSVILLVLPISYFVLKHTPIPELALVIHFIIAVLAQIVRLCFLRNYIKLSVPRFLKKVYVPVIFSLVLSLLISSMLFNSTDLGNSKFILNTLFSVSMGMLTSYLFVLDVKERSFVNNIIYNLFLKVIKK